MSSIMFKFPSILVIKGGIEVVHVNMVTSKYTYFQLPGCLIAVTDNKPDDFSFSGLIDYKDILIKMTFDLRYFYFSML
jgi:hypothetical protein